MPAVPIPRVLACVLALMVLAPAPHAATVQNLYEGVVTLADRSERGQAEAFRDAMRQVLVRITGRRDAAEDPALTALVEDARRYVQQFRVAGNQFIAGFDGARVERAVMDAGRPLWGHQRPATLVLLVSGEGAGRTLLVDTSNADLKQAVLRGAQLRGVPLVWPDAARPVSAAQASTPAPADLRAIGQLYRADAVLAGVAQSASPGSPVRWTLVQGEESTQWRGSAEDGPQGAADWFARVFAADVAGDGALVAITVSGIQDLRAYAAVTDYLQSLTLVRALSVEEVAGDNVVYRVQVQGGGERLARAISLGGRLEPTGDPGEPSLAAQTYRYRP